MAADGSIVIETDIKTAKAKSKFEKFEIDIEKKTQKFRRSRRR